MWFVKSRRAQNNEDFETWVAGGVAPTLNAFDNANENRATVTVAFHPTQTPVSGEVSPALGTTSQGMGVMAFDSYNQSLSETSQTIRKGQAGNDHVGMVMEKSVVRRLTPTECERLQGFPDGWTEGQADSHRYKQMGNAVAVPVVQWIIDRMTK
jgi:site-specific DNA-cytosine methylase